jgi:hypothetical protein
LVFDAFVGVRAVEPAYADSCLLEDFPGFRLGAVKRRSRHLRKSVNPHGDRG